MEGGRRWGFCDDRPASPPRSELMLFALIAVLPPSRFEDGDTLREFVPAALAYGTWGLTSVVGSALAWRKVSRRS
jgi:hypothetical protein